MVGITFEGHILHPLAVLLCIPDLLLYILWNNICVCLSVCPSTLKFCVQLWFMYRLTSELCATYNSTSSFCPPPSRELASSRDRGSGYFCWKNLLCTIQNGNVEINHFRHLEFTFVSDIVKITNFCLMHFLLVHTVTVYLLQLISLIRLKKNLENVLIQE